MWKKAIQVKIGVNFKIMFYITTVLKHFIVFCLLWSNIWETGVDIAICYDLSCLEFDSREVQRYSCIQNSPYWL